MTDPQRMKDLADVPGLIKARALDAEFAGELHPYVRAKYRELWTASRPAGKRFLRLWPTGGLPTPSRSLAELIAASPARAEMLRAMQADGVTIDPETTVAGDHACLVTSDPAVARKYGMHEETEFWSDR